MPRYGRITGGQRRFKYARRSGVMLMVGSLIALGCMFADRYLPATGKQADDLTRYDGKVFRVVHVVDGDTLDLDISDGAQSRTRVRLWGVDTPETKKPNAPIGHFGPEASAFTHSVAMRQKVTIVLERRRTRDSYGRLLAYVILPDGQMLNQRIVAEGYGYADPRFAHTHKKEFERLQRQAIKAGVGLWRDVRPQDLPPYYRDTLTLPEHSHAAGPAKPSVAWASRPSMPRPPGPWLSPSWPRQDAHTIRHRFQTEPGLLLRAYASKLSFGGPVRTLSR